MIPGRATAGGTSEYRERFPQLQEAGHFRRPEQAPGPAELWMSSIGLGTYLGEPDDSTDREYTAAIAKALGSGINVLDTAINYRHQRSERNIGAALRQVIDSGEVKRHEVVVCTKAGYLSFDGELPADPRGYFLREYVESGIIDPAQLAGGMHCMAPAYLENQIERSRRNLDLETIDVFYVHNPESQLAEVPREVFRQRLREAFATLEKLVKAGRIAYYGMATWSAFRLAEGARDYVSLEEVETLAREAGGSQHHFRFVQLPFSLAMPEAFALANQQVEKHKMSLLGAATKLGIAVVGSATLYQGHLTRGVPDPVKRILGLHTDAENAIQFSRSAPGLITALVGMAQHEHVRANMKVALVPPTPKEEWTGLFTKT
ncbi:MAG TPA: aldo/keto reductase [Candidatus Sulfotelmatobacter sp.]|nr:aldo/keto reductase [Candidatus Sulfotelmatobacter sp.]